jgi:hypothetical protein
MKNYYMTVFHNLNMPLDFDNNIEVMAAQVRGTTANPAQIQPFELKYLPTNIEVEMEYVPETMIERTHTDNRTEISVTVKGIEFLGPNLETLPYGANPRFPVLCNTFDRIFRTITSEPEDFVVENTGVDIFCSSYELLPNDRIKIVFMGEKLGIVNGGLTTSVLAYTAAIQQDLDLVRVSCRIWCLEDYEEEDFVEAADARNTHRELNLADRLNQLGAFAHIKSSMNNDWRPRWAFNVGDTEAEDDAEDALDICWLLYGFTISENEGHPTQNNPCAGGINDSIIKAGRLTSKNRGIDSMKGTVGL